MRTYIRLAGCALIIASSYIVYRQYRDSSLERRDAVRDAVMFVGFVSESISHRCLPIDGICREYESEYPYMKAICRAADEKTLAGAVLDGRDSFPPAAATVLYDFSRQIGRGYRDSEAAVCEEALKKLRSIEHEMSEKYEKDRRSMAALAAFAALSLILLFL